MLAREAQDKDNWDALIRATSNDGCRILGICLSTGSVAAVHTCRLLVDLQKALHFEPEP